MNYAKRNRTSFFWMMVDPAEGANEIDEDVDFEGGRSGKKGSAGRKLDKYGELVNKFSVKSSGIVSGDIYRDRKC